MAKTKTISSAADAEPETNGDPLEGLKVADLEPSDIDSGIIRADENGEFPEDREAATPETDDEGNIVISENGTTRVKLSFENFYAMFEGAFAFPGQLDPDYAPLAIQPEEEAGARATAELLYEFAEQYASWILIDFDTRLAKYLVAGGFLFTTSKKFNAIQKTKRDRRLEEAGARQDEADQQAQDAYSEAGMEPVTGADYAA